MWKVTLIRRIAALSVVCVSALYGIGVWLTVYPVMPLLLFANDTMWFEGIACRVGECTFVAPRLTGADRWYEIAQQRLYAHGWMAARRHPGMLDTDPDRYTRVRVVANIALWEQVTVTNEGHIARISVRRWIYRSWGRLPP